MEFGIAALAILTALFWIIWKIIGLIPWWIWLLVAIVLYYYVVGVRP